MALLAIAVGGRGAQAQDPAAALVPGLEQAVAGEAIDVPGLARLSLRVSRALAADQHSLELLQQLVRVPNALEERMARRLSLQFVQYERSLSDFRAEALALSDSPHSRVALFRALMSGQRTCWNLDLYNQQIETWGAGASDLRSILASREECARFRTAAFHPAVLVLVDEALVERGQQREEIRRLENELAALERLVEDLLEIDRAE